MKTVNMEMPVKNLTVIITFIIYYITIRRKAPDKKTEIQKREEEHPAVEKSKENEDSNYVKKSASHRIALRTAPVILANGNKRIKAIAFLDNGSTGTYVYSRRYCRVSWAQRRNDKFEDFNCNRKSKSGHTKSTSWY